MTAQEIALIVSDIKKLKEGISSLTLNGTQSNTSTNLIKLLEDELNYKCYILSIQ